MSSMRCIYLLSYPCGRKNFLAILDGMQTQKQSWWMRALLLFFSWRAWVFLSTALAFQFVPLRRGYLAAAEFAEGLPGWLTVWGNFDGVVFMRIARGGYGLPEVPFFPLLPLIMGVLHDLGIPFVLAGMLISLISFIGVLWVWRQLWQLDSQEKSTAVFRI